MPIPLPTIANTFRVALTWTESGTGQKAVNVLHIKTASGGQTPAAVNTCLNAHWTAAMIGDVVSSAQVTDIAITPLDGVSATQHFAPTTPAHWTGGIGGQFVPNVALIVKFSTASRGRANRGRIFLPFMPEGAIQNGFESAGNTVTMATAWATFDNAMTSDATTPQSLVVASYDRSHAGASAHASLITGIFVEPALATQRRRQSRLR